MTSESTTLKGTIERVSYSNNETGFAILQVRIRKEEYATVLGSIITPVLGETIEAIGEWVTDKQYGLQFKASQINQTQPSTVEGIEKYLGSGLIRGIGTELASRIIKLFGIHTFHILDNSPEKLKQVNGIGAKKYKSIIESWKEQRGIKDIMVFLKSHGVSTIRSAKIYQKYGSTAIARIKENPYILAEDISGIGFKSADTMAKKLGIEEKSPFRLKSGLHYVLTEAASSGHCCLPEDELLAKAKEVLNVEMNLISSALTEELCMTKLYEDKGMVFLPRLYNSEIQVAYFLKMLSLGNAKLTHLDIEKEILDVEQAAKIKLSETQKEAIRVVSKNKISIITGGPGVGKTTLVNSILKILEKNEFQFILCAPTGRAAKRMKETTGKEAKTIHRLLEYDGKKGFKRNETNPLMCDFIVVDEASMVDLQLFHKLVSAIPKSACVIIVGDVDQLPSVGAGNVLKDIIDSESFSVIRLTEIFRQAQESLIIKNAYRINQGYLPENEAIDPNKLNDFYFIEQEEPEKIQETVIKLVTERIPERFNFDPIHDIQVLVPMNKSLLGTKTFNSELQKVLNPNHTSGIEKYGVTFAVQDKVMQIENNYDKGVFNGDMGIVTEIDEEEQIVCVVFDGSIEVEYSYNELDQLMLAYCCSIHRSQGAEYKAVIMVVHTQHYALLQKNLVYTGVTRGKQLVILIGSKKAVAIAVKNQIVKPRYTQLKSRLAKLKATC